MKKTSVILTALLVLGYFFFSCSSKQTSNCAFAEIPGEIGSDVKTVDADLTDHVSVLKTLAPDEDIFAVVKESSGAVLIDFYADWCGPCQRQGRILRELEATAAQHNASIIKINVDDHPRLADRFRVASLPTLMFVKNGKIAVRRAGMADHKTIRTWLSR